MNSFDLFIAPMASSGLVAVLGYVRLLTFFLLVPFLGGSAIPGQLRISLAAALSFLVWPTFIGITPPEGSGLTTVLWFVSVTFKELLVGFMMAYAVSIVFWLMLSTGFLADNQRGACMGQATDPATGESSSLFGTLLNEVAIYLFFNTGAFLHVLATLLASYVLCPPGFIMGEYATTGIPIYFIGQFARLMTGILVFAGPIVLICLLSDVALGLVNRFAPQLNVFFLSMPIKSALGLMVIFIYLRTLIPLITQELFATEGHISQIWQVLLP